MLIKCIILRDVRNISSKCFEVAVERLTVHQDRAMGRLVLTADGLEQGAFSRAAGSHYADHLAPVYGKRHPVQRDLAILKSEGKVPDFEVPDNISLFLNDPLGKIASQDLPGIDANNVAIWEYRGTPDDDLPHHNRAIGLDDFERAYH